MGCLPYFKFYPADWLADVLDLTLEERGAYITFLAWSWKKDRPLPLDAKGRARILGTSPRSLRSLWAAIAEHWEETPEGFVNRRLLRERDKAMTKSAQATAAADARWGVNGRNADALRAGTRA